MKTTGYWIGY